MKTKRLDHVKNHFNNEADIFDERVVKVVPYYKEMLEALVTAIPFPPGQPIKVADLGCGTGTVASLVKQRFPKARILCVDMSQNMLDTARKKLKGAKGADFALAELGVYEFKGRYDAIVSSLALHHIIPGKDKTAVYKRIYSALKKGGIFVNADIIISKHKTIQGRYMKKWEKFVLESFSKEQARANYERYKREDRPCVLLEEMEVLKETGFRYVEVLWKYYNFATYCGIK